MNTHGFCALSNYVHKNIYLSDRLSKTYRSVFDSLNVSH